MRRANLLLVCAPLILATWACVPCDVECESRVDAGVDSLPELVTVIFRSSPELSDALVFSSNADFSLIESKKLGSDGSVEIQVRDGGVLSILEESAHLHSLVLSGIDWPRQAPAEILLPIPILQEDKTYRFTPSLTATADRHHFYACGDEVVLGTQTQEIELAISAECLTGDSFQVMAIAVREDRPIAYARADIAYDFEGTDIDPLDWRTDFNEQSFSIVPPLLPMGTTLSVRAFVQDIELAMLGPSLRFDGGLSKINVPPKLPEPSWYEVTIRGNGLFQAYLGPLPNQGSEWFTGPSNPQVVTPPDQSPRLVWQRSLHGDFLRGFCESIDLPRSWRWDFYGFANLTYVRFPELPADLTESAFPSQPLEVGECQVSSVDYEDLRGFNNAMKSGRLAWTASSPEFGAYIQAGQPLAIGGAILER